MGESEKFIKENLVSKDYFMIKMLNSLFRDFSWTKQYEQETGKSAWCTVPAADMETDDEDVYEC